MCEEVVQKTLFCTVERYDGHHNSFFTEVEREAFLETHQKHCRDGGLKYLRRNKKYFVKEEAREQKIQKKIERFAGLITRETAIFMLEKEKEFGEASE